MAPMQTSGIGSRDRESLLQVIRLRTRVAKAETAAISARRKAEFEQQLAAVYSYDDDAIWQQAHAIAEAAAEEAKKEIARRAEELGIPRRFAPSLNLGWYSRGENACKQRRAELTRVAYRKIDELEKDAKLQIERQSVDIQTRIVAGGLESAEARAFLDSMPTAEQLMPPVTVEQIEKRLGAASNADY